MRVTDISVDLTEATRRLAHAKLRLPVQPGTIACFTTPLWLPESHEKSGPVRAVASLRFFCNQNEAITELKWSRNPQAGHEYFVNVPRDVDNIYAEFDAIITRNVTRRMILFQWESVLLYPLSKRPSQDTSRYDIHKIPIQASVTVPKGWEIATALENFGYPIVAANETKTKYFYAITTVRKLADSPILAGLFFKKYPIEGSPNKQTREVLCLAADEEKYLAVDETVLDKLSKILSQAQLLFGGGPAPYAPWLARKLQPGRISQTGTPTSFFFLVAVSAHLPNWGGIEHLSSTEINVPENGFSTPGQVKENLQLLAHEYIHCWNGKHVLPRGHNPKDFNTPLNGRLLWVYEGLTAYYESVIAARAGVLSKQDWISQLAFCVANRMGEMAREWRSLEDIGTGNDVMRGGNGDWVNWIGDRAGIYASGALVWLGVDVLLRRLTPELSREGPKSLDDFMERFFGLPREHQEQASDQGEKTTGRQHRRTGTTVTEYTLDDIAQELRNICDYDWKGHFQVTVVDVAPEVDLSGITYAGYKFRWTNESPNKDRLSAEENKKAAAQNFNDEMKGVIWNSIGVRLSTDGDIGDVRRWGPADAAGLAPQQCIKFIKNSLPNGTSENFSLYLLVEEIRRSAESKKPILLSLAHQEESWPVSIPYFDGLRFPTIERDEDGGLADLFDYILRPRRASDQMVLR